MGIQDYHFITHWRFESPAERLYDLLSRPEQYPQWIKSFSLQVKLLRSGNSSGIGEIAGFAVKGCLPYVLRWELECVEAERPHTFTSLARGDLEGRGTWNFIRHGKETEIIFDWKVRGNKPLLRYTSFLFRPAFEWNHGWIMRRWEKDLRRALLL